MCQFGIIYYHFFQRRQTYIRQFFLLHRLYSIYLHIRRPPPIVTLTALNSRAYAYIPNSFFPKNQVHIYQTVYHLHHLCSRGCRNIPTGTIQISHYFRPANKPGPVLFISAAKGDFKTSLLSSCVCTLRHNLNFELLQIWSLTCPAGFCVASIR